jgi:hypothetical protein
LTIAEAEAGETSSRSAMADVETGSSLRVPSDQIVLA